MTTCMVT